MLNLDNFSIVLFILPVYQMMFYSVQLFTLRKNSDPSRRPLGFLMLLMLLYLVVNASRYLGYLSLYKYLYILQLPILLAVIPAYHLYLRAISEAAGRVFSRPGFVHFLPSVFILLLNVVALINLNPGQTDIFLSPGNSLSTNKDTAVSFALLIFLLGNAGFVTTQVVFTVVRYFRMNRKLVHSRESNPVYLPYFQSLWSHIIVTAVICFVIAASLMNFLTPAFNHIFSAVFNTGMLIFGGLAGYFGLKQDSLYMDVASVNTETYKISEKTDHPKEPAVHDSGKNSEKLSNEEVREIVKSLQHHFVADKPFLNSNLRAVDLAKSLGTSNQKLAYVINNIMETNFYGIVNKYRVIEAKELLKRPGNQHLNIDVISEMVGFQSKSSFNGCFKKMTGFTPSEFRKYNGK